jgi:very-short-patch-repair endonuclease
MSANNKARKLDPRVPRARKLRREVTDAERKLWQHLPSLRTEGAHFRRQATIGPYFVDFACHYLRTVIEVDGGQHSEAHHVERDARRTIYLQQQGYRVLRFWNNEVLTNVEGVMSAIVEALRDAAPQRPPPLTPPHHAARGGRGTETS